MTEESYAIASHPEAFKGESTVQLERARTAGGHVNDTSQPSLPVVHRRFANPAPLGLLSLCTSLFLICCFGLKVRGLATPNVMVGVLIFFGGACQFISGIMEFVSGNTFGATVFPSFGALSMSYGMIYLPGSGILAAYTDAEGHLSPTFSGAVGIYLWAWFCLAVCFTVASVRSSWVLFVDFLFLDLFLLILACGHMLDNVALERAGYAIGYIVIFLSCWAGMAGLCAGGITPFEIPIFPMYEEDAV